MLLLLLLLLLLLKRIRRVVVVVVVAVQLVTAVAMQEAVCRDNYEGCQTMWGERGGMP
jgi:peptidoglycan/LPS O-acetylase OafA/YrhL